MHITCLLTSRPAVLKILFSILFISSCQSNVTDDELIDYDELDELETEVVIDTGDYDDHFGHLFDLFIASDGSMLATDVQVTAVEQFDTEGRHVGTIAEGGQGPGEIPRGHISLVNGGNDTLIVRPQVDIRRDYYVRNNDGKYHFYFSRNAVQQASGDYVHILGLHSDSTFYARVEDLNRDRDLPYSKNSVVITDKSGQILRDSLNHLKIPNALRITHGETTQSYGAFPFSYRDMFRVLEDGRYMIARPDSSALYFYNHANEPDRKVSLPVKERPLESDDLDYALRNIPDDRQVRRGFEERAADVKPPFLDIRLDNEHILLHTDMTKETGDQFVVLSMDAEPVGKFYLTGTENVTHFQNNRVYTLYNDPETGSGIRVYEVKIE